MKDGLAQFAWTNHIPTMIDIVLGSVFRKRIKDIDGTGHDKR